ncbi:MAG: tetratricopeptide repeat protein [Armatimonadetes bacterium]|nr:tetratricopeptide repeat protein [Armatimonadota bacterium]
MQKRPSMERRRFADYEMENKLGAGAMGEVWRATDLRLARPVALKLLSPARVSDEAARIRFFREARASSALNHPNIVTVFEAGEWEQQPFLAIELIEGQTLREMLGQGALPRPQALEVARQMLRGLAVAHAAGIIHRDIKPENVMVRRDGFVKVLDFGLAEMLITEDERLTRTNTVVGTPLYMSPEQAMGKPLDERTDVFSAASVIYEMLAGRPPIQSEVFYEIINELLERDPPPINGVSTDLNDLLKKALQRNRDRRYRDARSFFDALTAITSERPDRDQAERPAEEASLIVLPLTASQEDEEVADGIVDEIITSLEKIQGLRVIARSTAMRYRGQDARAVGRELNVGLALEGTLRRSGGRVRVTAGMIDARSGFRVWGDRFESRLSDIFDMQDDIAGGIVRALKARFSAIASLAQGATVAVDTEANEHYYRGISLLGTLSPDHVANAVDALQKAVALQPDFAPAHARLAEALFHHTQMFPEANYASTARRAYEEATRALELDPSNADALFALGMVHLSDPRLDLVRARAYMRRALEQSPNFVPALSWLAYIQVLRGHAEETESLARRAIARDPQSSNHYIWLGISLFSQGNFEGAADAFERTLRLEPRNPFPNACLVILDTFRGRLRDAERMVRFVETFGENHPVLKAALLIYQARAEGLTLNDVSERDLTRLRSHLVSARFTADIPALHGDAETAVEWLRVAFKRGDRNVAMLDSDPFLEPIRNTPAFKAYREEMRAALEADAEIAVV